MKKIPIRAREAAHSWPIYLDAAAEYHPRKLYALRIRNQRGATPHIVAGWPGPSRRRLTRLIPGTRPPGCVSLDDRAHCGLLIEAESLFTASDMVKMLCQ